MDIEHIIQQLPTPFILLGDFNVHSSLWGSIKTDPRGKEIERLLEKDNISLLNDSTSTHINIANGNFSCIDLSICSSSLAHRIEWKVLPDIFSSDHIPIKIFFIPRTGEPNKNKSQRWNLKNPNWTLFSEMVDDEVSKLSTTNQLNINDIVSTFTSILTLTAEKTIGNHTNQTFKPKVPWWNDAIKEDIQNKKKALNTFKKNKTQEHFKN